MMGNYVYELSDRWTDEQGYAHVLYTVGFYDPQGKWYPESDHDTADSAAARVRYLNGGRDEKLLALLADILPVLKEDVENCGPCDHAVNICVCGIVDLCDRIKAALDQTGGK